MKGRDLPLTLLRKSTRFCSDYRAGRTIGSDAAGVFTSHIVDTKAIGYKVTVVYILLPERKGQAK